MASDPPPNVANTPPASRRWSWSGSLRGLPVSRRLFLIVALNAVALLALAALVWGGARVIESDWEEVRQAEDHDRLFVAINSDIGRLQGLVHRGLYTPTDTLAGEIDERRENLLSTLENILVLDSEMAEEVGDLIAASRRFLDSFDTLSQLTRDKRANYETEVLKAGGEMSGLFALLDSIVRERNPVLMPTLGRSREAFSDGLLAANAVYLSGDDAAAERARKAFDSIDQAIPVLRDLADDDLQRGTLDAMRLRIATLTDGLMELRANLERQNHLVKEEIDDGQRGMAQTIDRLIARVRRRDEEAQRHFDLILGRVGWALLTFGVLFLGATAAASSAIGRSIRRPLHGLMAEMTAIAGGDYARPIHGTGVPDEIGAMARSLAVFKDNAIAKRQVEAEREAQERRWRTMLETSPVGISIVCADSHRRLYTNPSYDRLFAIGDGAWRDGEPVASSFVDPGAAERLIAAFTAHGQVNGLEVERRRRDGSRWWCLLDLRPMEYDGQPAYIAWHYDVTFRHHSEEALRAAKERAEDALAELRATQRSLIQAEKMASLGALVAGIAHEINTPVGLTVTAASFLADRTGEFAGRIEAGQLRRADLASYVDVALEASQRILHNADRAAQLIQSFKQVAVDQTHNERRAFDLGHYIDEILMTLGPRLRPSGVTVTVDCRESLIVDGDPGPIAQVLTNFTVNALMHAFDERAAGQLRLTVSEPADDEVELVFADDGKGIPPDIQPKIFDPFFTTNRTRGGTGLGLNIVYNLVQQKLKGRLSVSSAPGKGTAFTLRFPRRYG